MSSLPLPGLDDRTFAQLVREGRAMIPGLAPQWTDENASDPGITLIELLAWLTEMLLFRIDQVPPPYVQAFLALLNGPDWSPGSDLDADVATTLACLRRQERAITAADYQLLARRLTGVIARLQVLPRRNLEAPTAAGRARPAPAHVSLVVVPDPGAEWAVAADSPDTKTIPLPSTTLLDRLRTDLAWRQPIATHLHVVGPEYLGVAFAIRLAKTLQARVDEVKQRVLQALAAFLSPLAGGPDKDGWPFGRAVYISDVFLLLASVPGVATVLEVTLIAGSQPLLYDGAEPVALVLADHQLPYFDPQHTVLALQGVAP